MPIELRPDEFPIRYQFGARERLSRLETMVGVKPHVPLGEARGVKSAETSVDACGVADLALLRDEVVLDEGDERRPQWRTKQCRDLIPEVRITGRVMSEMDDLAARWIRLHRASPGRLKARRPRLCSGSGSWPLCLAPRFLKSPSHETLPRLARDASLREADRKRAV